MRRKFLVSATLALLLLLATASAWAAYCTACGLSISDSAHLCPRCGARQMPSSSAVAITRIRSGSDGTVTVNWSGGVGPYTILCAQKRSSEVSVDLADDACMGFQPAASCLFDGHSGTADRLVPGQDYWIAVRDAKGRLAYRAWIPGSAPAFPDFPVRLSLQLQSRTGTLCQAHSFFSAGDITANPAAAYSADVLLTYPALTCEQSFTAKVCITAPNGAALTDTVTDLHLPAGSDSHRIATCDLSRYFSLLLEHYGCIPVGEYTLSIYFDGMYAGSDAFRITD